MLTKKFSCVTGRAWRWLLFGVFGAVWLAACSGTPSLSDADIQATIAAAVQGTVDARATVDTAVAETVAARQIAAAPTWTPIAVVNPDTPTPAASPLPPPSSTPLPTSTLAVTAEPTATEEPPTPAPTAVPPTSTAGPTQAAPPPAPATAAPPADPVLGTNILVNGSFEDGWYNQNGIPELQLPNGWGFEYDLGPTGFGSQPWDVWIRPETRVLPDNQLPAAERPLFIRHGRYTIKMFKGNGAISFRVLQDIALPAGHFVFQVQAFPDLVTGYDNNGKIFAADPLAGELRFIAPDGGTGWLLPAAGQWNTFEHTFTLAAPQTVRIGVGIRGRYAVQSNGWFFDNWSLRRIEN